MNNRIHTFDILKGIAILSVIYTHCIQFLGIGNYWHHPIFKLTYAFHMPLFMIVSGYFSYRALLLPMKELIKQKSIRLLLPCFTAAIIVIVVNHLMGWTQKHAGITEFISNLWYLKSLFLCMVIAKASTMCWKKNAHLAIWTGLLIALPIHQYHVNFMMPFFWMGYLWHKHPVVIHQHASIILGVSLLLFLMLWPFWDGIYTTYATPLKLFHLQSLHWLGFGNLLPYLFRLTMGTAGSGVIICSVILLYKQGIRMKWLSDIGQYTLELYSLHFLFINIPIMKLCSITYEKGLYEGGYCVLFTVGILAICLGLIKWIYSSKMLSLLLFGKTITPPPTVS